VNLVLKTVSEMEPQHVLAHQDTGTHVEPTHLSIQPAQNTQVMKSLPPILKDVKKELVLHVILSVKLVKKPSTVSPVMELEKMHQFVAAQLDIIPMPTMTVNTVTINVTLVEMTTNVLLVLLMLTD